MCPHCLRPLLRHHKDSDTESKDLWESRPKLKERVAKLEQDSNSSSNEDDEAPHRGACKYTTLLAYAHLVRRKMSDGKRHKDDGVTQESRINPWRSAQASLD